MRELTERYVAATLRSIPEIQKADIEAELRTSIDDAVDARVADGDEPETAEKQVLTELGDPDRLAADYVGRPTYLIGPEHFFDYKRLVTVLLITVVPVVLAVVAVVQLIAGQGIGRVFGETIGIGLSLVLHIVFWTTLVFALIERSGEKAKTPDWTLTALPPMPTAGTIKLGDTIGSVIFLVIAVVGMILARSVSPLTAGDGTPIPIFNQEMWDFWFPFFITILLVEVIFELVKYRVGRWTWLLASANLALNAVFVIPAVYVLASERVFNPVFFEELGWGLEPAGDGAPVLITVALIVLIAAWDIVDGFRKARHVR